MRSAARSLYVLCLAGAVLLAACSGGTAGDGGALDAGVSGDAGSGGQDAGADAGTDAGLDSGVNADGGVPTDGGTDAGATDAGVWSGAVVVDPSFDQGVDSVHLASDGQGNALAVWDQALNDGGGYPWTVYGAAFRDGGWSTPVRLDANLIPTHNQTTVYPQVAMSSNGTGMAVWEQNTAGGYTAPQFAQYTPQSGWSAPQAIPVSATSYNVASLAMDGLGDAVISYLQQNPPTVWASIFAADGGGWGTASSILSDATLNTFPEVALASNGSSAFSVFAGPDGGLYASRHPSLDGGWTAPAYVGALVDAGVATQLRPDSQYWISEAPDGTAFAVWTEETSHTTWTVMAAQFVGGTWSAAAPLATGLVGNNWNPQVGTDSAGNAVAAWRYAAPGAVRGSSVYASVYAAGAGWGTPALVMQDTGNPFNSVHEGLTEVAVAPGGRAVVSGSKGDLSAEKAYAALYSPGAGWSPDVNIDTLLPGEYSGYDSNFGPLRETAAASFLTTDSFILIWSGTPSSGASMIFGNTAR